ncbi:MAG: CapA family protein [Pseudomonadota bacterium]
MLLLGGCATTPEPAPEPPPPPPIQEVQPELDPTPPPPIQEAQPELDPTPPPPPPKRPITFAAVGDIMIGTDFPSNRLPPEDGATSFSHVGTLLQGADVTFGNLEGVLQDGGEPFKVCQNPKLCYLFRSPARYAKHFFDAGFDVMSLANNHARDFGEDGRDSSMRALAEWGIHHSGRIGDVASFTSGDYTIAMIAFAPNPGSHDINDIEGAALAVRNLSSMHDLVMVSFHGGAEGVDAQHLTFDNETYYGEQRGNVVAFARRMVDEGADFVIGHGPHVLRAVEVYSDRFIAYSLGNFNTYYGISIAGIKGLAPILNVTLNEHGEFLHGKIVSTRQARPGGPRLDESHAAARSIRALTESDFGDTRLQIDDEGNMTLLPPDHSTGPQ